MNIVLLLIEISQGLTNKIFDLIGTPTAWSTILSLPKAVSDVIDSLKWYEHIVMWLPQFIGALLIVGIGIGILISVYGRFFKLFMYIGLSPIPLASFASSNTQNMGIIYLKNLASATLQVSVIALACVIFQAFLGSGDLGIFTTDLSNESAMIQLFFYIVEICLNMIIFFGLVKISDRITKDILGLH